MLLVFSSSNPIAIKEGASAIRKELPKDTCSHVNGLVQNLMLESGNVMKQSVKKIIFRNFRIPVNMASGCLRKLFYDSNNGFH
jgi:hypothetical protein